MTEETYPDFIISLEEREDSLYIFTAVPEDNLNIGIKLCDIIYSKVIEYNTKNVLIEEDFSNQITTTGMYEVIKYMSELFTGKVILAHVDTRLSDIDLNKFGETVGVNRGLVGKVFNNRTDAVKWLKTM